mgnify:CR=1 FL=1
MKKAIYPGTFDPITFGHIDLIKKSLNIFDKVIVAVSDGNTKNYLFSAEERENLIKKASSYGIDIDNYTINWSKVIKRSRNISTRLSKGIEFLMKKRLNQST